MPRHARGRDLGVRRARACSSSSRTIRSPSPATARCSIKVVAGRHQLRRHPRPRELLPRELRAAADPRRRGGGRGRRAARGRRSPAPAATRSTRWRRSSPRSRSPTASSDNAALGIVVQGLSAWHLLKTSSHLAEGETRRRPRRRGRGRHARRPARQALRRRPRDRDRLDRGEARAGARARRRRRGRPQRGGPQRRAARGQRRQQGRHRARDGGRRASSTSRCARWRPSAASSPTASPHASPTRSPTAR